MQLGSAAGEPPTEKCSWRSFRDVAIEQLELPGSWNLGQPLKVLPGGAAEGAGAPQPRGGGTIFQAVHARKGEEDGALIEKHALSLCAQNAKRFLLLCGSSRHPKPDMPPVQELTSTSSTSPCWRCRRSPAPPLS
jgi:hypothetical protein